MSHIHQEVRVAAPVDHVFKLACDVGRQPEWNPYMEIWNVSGPIDQVGTTFDSTLRLLGQSAPSTGTIAEVVPQRLIDIKGVTADGGSSDWVYRFEPAGQETVCTLDIDYTVSGLWAATLDRLVFHAALERATRHMAENFAALATTKVLQAT